MNCRYFAVFSIMSRWKFKRPRTPVYYNNTERVNRVAHSNEIIHTRSYTVRRGHSGPSPPSARPPATPTFFFLNKKNFNILKMLT